jgi:DNA topoisomerase IB
MARRGGWRRVGSRRRFRYEDSRGNRITDEDKLRRIDELVIPPAWRDVWISPRPNAKLQATGVDAAGRRQYLYHPEYRARQEQAKYDKLVRFAEHLPDSATMSMIWRAGTQPDWTCALAVKLINSAGSVSAERYTKRIELGSPRTKTTSSVKPGLVQVPRKAQGLGSHRARRR